MWAEITAAFFSMVLVVIAIGAYRIRAADPKMTHLWFGLSRDENGRLGAIVALVGFGTVGVIDLSFFGRHPIIAIGWGVLIILFAYRGWVRSGSRPGGRPSDA